MTRSLPRLAQWMTFGVILSCASLYSAQYRQADANDGNIRVISVASTPEPDNVQTILVFPEHNQIVKNNPVNMQIRLEGYSVGTNSYFPRASEIWNDPKGQSVHIVIDNRPYFGINEAMVDTLDDYEIDYEQVLDFNLPFDLEPGVHTIRAFPVRSFNESLKGDQCFVSDVFYYKTRKQDGPDIDLTQPYLTYNEPEGSYDLGVHQPILLDFYISNCELSNDGYKVKLLVDGSNERILTQWTPYYIYGLKKGTHTIRLQLLNPQNKIVPGAFNDTTRSFTIE